jgi:hypothetical protein
VIDHCAEKAGIVEPAEIRLDANWRLFNPKFNPRPTPVVVINDVQSAAWASDAGYRESVHKFVPLVGGNLTRLGHLASDLYHSKRELRWAQLK